MEEMSKKTKRLEKENLALTRKHEATNQNIIKMAEERTRSQKELQALRKKNENLEKLCRGMQAQGRGVSVTASNADEDDASGSEYDEDEDEGSIDDDFEEDSDAALSDRPIAKMLPNGTPNVKGKVVSTVPTADANGVKA
jgi:seryl-tRNA synthetase